MNNIKNIKGFTVIEVLIVLAIIVAVGAIVTPRLIEASDLATLKSDIVSAKVIGDALAFYDGDDSENLEVIISELISNSYLKPGSEKPQIANAQWIYVEASGEDTPKIVKLDIATGSVPPKYVALLDLISEADQIYVNPPDDD